MRMETKGYRGFYCTNVDWEGQETQATGMSGWRAEITQYQFETVAGSWADLKNEIDRFWNDFDRVGGYPY